MIYEWTESGLKKYAETEREVFCLLLELFGIRHSFLPYFPLDCFHPPLMPDAGDDCDHVDVITVLDESLAPNQFYFKSREGTMIDEPR